MVRTCSAVVAIGLVATLSSASLAQPAPAPSADGADAAALEQQLERDFEALSTGDCSVACRALGSMRRATARLCALEPGPRCSAARAKLDDAQNRVRTACPECAVDTDNAPPAARATESPDAAGGRSEPAAAPPPESARGGCAGCEVGGDAGSAGGALAVLALVGISLLRRRRR